MAQKLIILRGSSAAGKSTAAKVLFSKAKHKTCLIEQDYYRFIFRPHQNGSKANSPAIHQMIKDNVLTALSQGYDVILEGILNTKSYQGVFDEIFSTYPVSVHAFYFDVSLDETIRRHKLRPPRNTPTYTEDNLRAFYNGVHQPIHKDEMVIAESTSADEALAYIVQMSGVAE